MKTKPKHTSATDTTEAVDAFMESLVHPMKSEIQMIRETILAADPTIQDGVKWNAPSYRTSEYFATTNLREKQGVGVILHLGAKARDLKPGELQVEDPTAMLTWLAKDRAMVRFTSGSDFQTKASAFTAVVRSWIRHV